MISAVLLIDCVAEYMYKIVSYRDMIFILQVLLPKYYPFFDTPNDQIQGILASTTIAYY